MKTMKKRLAFLLALGTVFLMLAQPAFAEGLAPLSAANVTYPSGVTEQMCDPGYWKDKALPGFDEVLLTTEEIAAVNQAAIDGAGTQVFDLHTVGRKSYNAAALRDSLATITVPTRELYIDGVLIDNDAYFGSIRDDILATAFSEESRSGLYSVAVRRTDLRAYPISDIIGYSPADPDDEMENAALAVNEPFIVRQMCERAGEVFYWGYSTNCTGWVNARDMAICTDEAEWDEAWQVELDGDDFLVVTEDKIVLEPSISVPYSSEVKLTLGTILKLVPKDEIPANIGERNGWNNHVVYLPTRGADGEYVRQMALISQHSSVSIGFLPFTQENVLKVAFSCLGNRYGWGGMLDAMDCTLYSRTIYRCFGFELPRNTTWQQLVPGTKIDIGTLNDTEKQQFLSTLPAGALLYFPGHCMVYVGEEGGVGYVISALGTASDSEGDLEILSIYNCVLNPLTVRRRNGLTWLQNLDGVVLVTKPWQLADCDINVQRDGSVSISRSGVALSENVHYTSSIEGNTVTLTGLRNVIGTLTLPIPFPEKDPPYVPPVTPDPVPQPALEPSAFTDVLPEAYYADAVKWAVNHKIVTGMSRTVFAPDMVCTRAQIVTMLYRAAGCPAVKQASLFRDIAPGSYYADAVTWAVQKGITNGAGNGYFRPDQKCTRAEFVTFLMRFAGVKSTWTDSGYRDVPTDAYYAGAVAWAADHRITSGISQSQFAPMRVCTRAEAVVFLFRYFAGRTSAQ
ncbi:MAG: S-layer homology domain-containing protein [Clostridia bacterium]|nr:S-layer homology domain-containing protein [Clostridia bacterium]